MEVRLTLCAVVVTIMFGGCLSETCSTGTSTSEFDKVYCKSGCCGNSPYHYCCSPPSSGEDVVSSAVLDSRIIGLIVFGVILVVSTFIAIFCCMLRSRGAGGILVNRQGMTTMTTASTIYTTNGHQQPSWQYPQQSAPYHQQPAASRQQPVASNFQQQYYSTGQTHAHTAGDTPLPSYTVNNAVISVPSV